MISFPRYFILALIVMLAIPLLTACSTLAIAERGAVMVVDRYCSVSASKRKLIRAAVASRLESNSIQINCSE
jgi:hypothetical protein